MRVRAADAVIVGGGLIGVSIAWRLAQQNLRVLVLDKSIPGSEASAAAAGILSPKAESASPSPLFWISEASLRAYPAFADELKESTGVDIELSLGGVISVARNQAEMKKLNQHVQWQFEMELNVERLAADEVAVLEPRLDPAVTGGVLYPKDGQVENVRLTKAAIMAASRSGVRFVTGDPVQRILHRKGRVEGVESAGGRVDSRVVVNSAGAWAAFDRSLPFPVPVGPARGEILALSSTVLPERVVYSQGVYLVPRRDGRVILGATTEFENYDKTVKAGAVLELLGNAVNLMPELRGARFGKVWAGLRPYTPDRLPILGPSPIEGLFYATGHFRNGILLTPLTARVLSELIVAGTTDVDLSPFSVCRFSAKESYKMAASVRDHV